MVVRRMDLAIYEKQGGRWKKVWVGLWRRGPPGFPNGNSDAEWISSRLGVEVALLHRLEAAMAAHFRPSPGGLSSFSWR